MENIITYSEFKSVNESKVNEGKGIHPAVRTKLIDFVKKNPNCKFEDAQKHISKSMKNWKLSKEDFEEAKKEAK